MSTLGNRNFVEVSRASFVLVFSSPASQSIVGALVEVRSQLICGWMDGRWFTLTQCQVQEARPTTR